MESNYAEENISTEQPPPRQEARFQGAHGDQERPDHPEPPPGAGPQAPVGLTGVTQRLAVSAPITLIRRADFLAAARARRKATPGFTLQARRREDAEAEPPVRVGYTCSKKVGNAVARNRAKRRLRAAARAVLPAAGRPGWDYVLIGRAGATATRPFAQLVEDLGAAVASVHAERRT